MGESRVENNEGLARYLAQRPLKATGMNERLQGSVSRELSQRNVSSSVIRYLAHHCLKSSTVRQRRLNAPTKRSRDKFSVQNIQPNCTFNFLGTSTVNPGQVPCIPTILSARAASGLVYILACLQVTPLILIFAFSAKFPSYPPAEHASPRCAQFNSAPWQMKACHI